MYALKQRKPEENFFASIRTTSGGACWEHVRTNLGRRVAYSMIAKHWDGDGRIESFRDQTQATSYDKEGLAQGSDGILRKNLWSGHDTRNESFY